MEEPPAEASLSGWKVSGNFLPFGRPGFW